MNRILDVIDEQASLEKECRSIAYENVRKDKTYDEFMKTYKSHIEGKVDPNIRCADRPETAAFDPAKLRTRKPKANANPYEEEEKAELRKLIAKPPTIGTYSSVYSSTKPTPTNKTAPASELKDAENLSKMNDSQDKFNTEKATKKDDMASECRLEILRNAEVEELDDDYLLVVHPFPQMEGEMLLFQNIEQESKKCLYYRDYSL